MITVANFLDLNLGLIDWHALAILKKEDKEIRDHSITM